MKELLEELQQFLLTEQDDLDELSAALNSQQDKISGLEREIEALKSDITSSRQSHFS